MKKIFILVMLMVQVICTLASQSRNTLLFESFESSEFPPSGWTLIDNDNDGNNWKLNNRFAQTGGFSAISHSWDNGLSLNPDNYLITPAITLPAGTILLEYYYRMSIYAADFYSVLISETTPSIGSFELLLSESVAGDGFRFRSIDISDYSGKTVYVAFQHHDSFDNDYVILDDIRIYQQLGNDLSAVSITGSSFPVAGIPSTYTFRIRNDGVNNASSYVVRLMEGNTQLVSTQGTALPSTQSRDFNLTFTPTVSGLTEIYGEILWAVDEYQTNNKTEPKLLEIQNEGVIVSTISNPSASYWEYNYPVDFFAASSVMQMIYHSSFLPEAGVLNKISYVYSGLGAIQDDVPIQIYLSNTNLNQFDDLDFIPLEDFTLVYDDGISLATPGIQNVIIPIEPFAYVGGNLAVMVYKPWLDDTPYLNDRWEGSILMGAGSRILSATSDTEIINLENLDNFNAMMTNASPNTTLFFSTTGMGTLSGFVTHNGSPISDANVMIDGTNVFVTTNSSGEYVFPYMQPGNYNLTVSKVGYLNAYATDVVVIGDQINTFDFEINLMITVAVSGRIISSVTNEPLTYVRVRISGYAEFDEVLTDSQGLFSFPEVFGHSDYVLIANYFEYNELIHHFSTSSTDLDLGDVMIYEINYPPRNVWAEENKDNVHLTWEQPKFHNPNLLSFTHSTNDYFSGVGAGNVDWMMAHRYSSAQLHEWDVAGYALHEVGFMLDSNSTIVSLDIRIYTGGSGAPLDPGTLIYEQSVSPHFLEYFVWNEIALNSTVIIPTDKEMWIAIRASSQGYPFMVDTSPMVSGYGNVIFIRGEWRVMDQDNPLLLNNWMIKGTIDQSNFPENYGIVGFDNTSKTAATSLHYNIFRSTRENINNPALWTTLATNYSETEYYDYSIDSIADLTFYRYIVTAEYANNNVSSPILSNQLIMKPKDMDYIGNPSSPITNQALPFDIASHTSLIQSIYLEEEFSRKGTITSIMLTVLSDGNGSPERIYQLYMASTNREEFMYNIADWIPYEEFTLVWEGVLPVLTPGIYEVFITLDTPFDYTHGNLAIMTYGEFLEHWAPFNGFQISSGYTVVRSLRYSPSYDFPHPKDGFPENETNSYTVANIGFVFDDVGDDSDKFVTPFITSVKQNYPNPFNPFTTIEFTLAKPGNVQIDIYNIRGQKVRSLVDERYSSGSHSVKWDGNDNLGKTTASGVYFYRMQTEGYDLTRRMVLLK